MAGNSILKREGFYISFNPHPSIGYEGSETALVVPSKKKEKGRDYFILVGDFREEYEKATTLEQAMAVFNKHQDKVGSWSD